MRTAIALLSGSTSAPTKSIRPGKESVASSLVIITGCPLNTEPTSLSKTLPITHTEERSAMVNAGAEPACSSWPGVIIRETTMPGSGARMADWAPGTCLPSRMASIDSESTPSALSCRAADTRSSAAEARSACDCSSSARGSASLANSFSFNASIRSALRHAVSAFRKVATSAAKSGDATVASTWPAPTVSPGSTRTSDTGPEIAGITSVDLSPLKFTVPVV